MSAIVRRTHLNTKYERLIVCCPKCKIDTSIMKSYRSEWDKKCLCGHYFITEEIYDEWDEKEIIENCNLTNFMGDKK